MKRSGLQRSFAPPKQETFFKDDANHDPQWTEEEIISAGFEFNGLKIGKFMRFSIHDRPMYFVSNLFFLFLNIYFFVR